MPSTQDLINAQQIVEQLMMTPAQMQGDAQAGPQPMDEGTLKSIINQKMMASHQWYGTGKLASQHMQADRYYRGDLLGNEQEGRSAVVSRDVFEVVEGVLPDLMRIFTGGDEVVQFEPFGPEDEEAAQQATDYINYLFLQKNEGFKVLYTIFKDALLKRNGIGKVWAEKRINRTKERYQGITLDQYTNFIANNPCLEVVEAVQYDDPYSPPQPVLGPDGQPVLDETGGPVMQASQLVDCTVMQSKPEVEIKVAAVAPDEFVIERRAVDIEKVTFLAQRSKRTISDLLECGFDRDAVMSIPSGGDNEYSQERIERYKDEDSLPWSNEGETLDPTMRKVWVSEAYIKVDFDGDGLAEWRKVTLAGDLGVGGTTILANEEVDDHPFFDVTPTPLGHKFFGWSLYDQVKDIQEIKTALLRGALDSIYLANSPRIGAVEGQVNIDDLLDKRVGGIVRLKNPNAVVPMPTEMAAPQAFQMIEYMEGTREQRTGVTRYNQGLNADSLNKTATGINLITNAGQQRKELIARVFAETGVKRLFRRLFALTCMYQDQPKMVKLRNKWVQVNPRDWKDRMDVTVNVALGAGNKEQQIQTSMMHLNIQKEIVAMQGGLTGPLIDGRNIYNTLKKLVQASGWKNVEPYYSDPANAAPPPPPQPDFDQQIEMQKVQSQADEKQMALAKDHFIAVMNNETQKYLGQLDAEVKLAIAKLNKPPEIEAEEPQLDEQGNPIKQPTMQDMMGMLAQHINNGQMQVAQGLQSMAQAINRPKQVLRDEQGNLIGVQ